MKNVPTAELAKLQRAIAEGRAPKPPTDGEFYWHPRMRLALRLYISGRGIWIVKYRNDRGMEKTWKIGNAAEINLTTAEKAAAKVLGKVSQGEDPQKERKELRALPKRTVKALCEEFFAEMNRDPDYSAKTERGYRNIVKNHLGPLRDVLADELCQRQDDLVAHIRKVNTEVSAQAARALRITLAAVYKWAITVYPKSIPFNPVRGTWEPKYIAQNPGQALTMEELGAIWRACETMAATAVPTFNGNALGGRITLNVQPTSAFVTVTEAAQLTGMHPRSLRNMAHAGQFRMIMRQSPKKAADAIKRRSYLIAAEELKQFTGSRASKMRSVDFEYSVIIRLLILLGGRYMEMAGLRWSELTELDEGILHIPTRAPDGTRRIKSNGGKPKDLILHLPQAAVDLIKTVPKRPDRDFLFGMGPHGLTENDIQKKKLDAIIAANESEFAKSQGEEWKSMRPWVLHWLRHSFTTHLSEDLQVDPRVIEVITNHLPGEKISGQHKHYSHAKFADTQRRVLTEWARRVRNAADRVVEEEQRSNVKQLFGQPAEAEL